MSWRPTNSLYGTENFESQNTGEYLYGSFSGQNQLGGIVSLRNIATGDSVSVPAGEPWPGMTFREKSDFSLSWPANSGQWSWTGSNDPLLDTSSAATAFIGAQHITQTGYSHTFTGADRDLGFLIEGSWHLPVMTGAYGLTDNFYGLYIGVTGATSNTNRHEYIRAVGGNSPGFAVGTGLNKWFVPVTSLDTHNVGFRFGVRGTTGQLVTSEGFSVVMTGVFEEAGGNDYNTLLLGDISTTRLSGTQQIDSRFEIGKIYQKHLVSDIGGDFIADTKYSTGSLSFYSSNFQPDRPISNYGAAYYQLVGSSGGETKLIAEYDNSLATGFTAFASGVHTSTASTGLYNFGLTGAPVVSDGTDKLRFQIVQNSTDGSQAPLGVEYITVSLSQDEATIGLIYLSPSMGSSEGEFPVLLSIDPNSVGYKRAPVIQTGITDFLVHFNEGNTGAAVLDEISNTTGLVAFPASGQYGTIQGVFSGAGHNYRALNAVAISQLEDVFIDNGSLMYMPVAYGKMLTNATKGYTGELGLHPYSSAAGFTGGAGSIGPSAVIYDTQYVNSFEYENGTLVPKRYAAQAVQGQLGIGFETPVLTTDVSPYSHIVVECLASIDQGGMEVSITGGSGRDSIINPISYSSIRADGVTRYRSIFSSPSTTGNYKIQFYGTGASTNAFRVADVNVKGFTGTSIVWDDITGQTASPNNISMDAWVKTDGYSSLGTGSIIAMSTGDADTAILGIDSKGFPFFEQQKSATYNNRTTSSIGIDTNTTHHILGQYVDRTAPYSGRLEIYVDGELGGLLLVGDNYAGTSDSQEIEVGRNFVGMIDEVRVRNISRNPHEAAVLDAYSVPLKFQSEYQNQTGSNVHLMYRFDDGTIADYGDSQFHAIVTESGNAHDFVDRESEGVFGEGVAFLGTEGHALATIHTGAFAVTGNHVITSFLAAQHLDTSKEPSIFELGNVKLSLYQDKFLKFQVGTQSLTGTTDMTSPFAYRYFAIQVTGETNYEVTCKVSNTTGEIVDFTGTFSSYMWTGNSLRFGHDPSVAIDDGDIYLDEFAVLSGNLSDYNDFTGLNQGVVKGKPNEYVYFNDVQLGTGRVNHLGVYDKEVIIPPRQTYDYTGTFARVSVDTQIGNIEVIPRFTYIGARYIVPDSQTADTLAEITEELCKTRSPFRVGSRVPDGAINLAYMTTPSYSVDNNLSLLDGSDSNNSANFAPSFKDTRSMSTLGIASGSTNLIFTGQIETDNVVVTTYAMQRKNVDFIAPLFYKYNLGGDRHFLFQTGSTNDLSLPSGDIALIRQNIYLTYGDGATVDIVDYPWDIRVSKERRDGYVLPSNVFNVEILTRDKFIPGRTVFVNYTAGDSVKKYIPIRGHKEIINSEPIFHRMKESLGIQETFYTEDLVDFTNVNTVNLDRGPLLNVDTLTGAWFPGIHNEIVHEDEFLL